MSIGYDDVVHKEEAHYIACLLYIEGKLVVLLAWGGVVAWMIVAQGDDSGVVEQSFLDDEPYVYRCLCDASM